MIKKGNRQERGKTTKDIKDISVGMGSAKDLQFCLINFIGNIND